VGHAPESAIKRAVKNEAIVGSRVCYEDIKDLKLQFCEACQMGRMKVFTPAPESDKMYDVFEKIDLSWKCPLSVSSAEEQRSKFLGVYLSMRVAWRNRGEA
jgi:hypothetical protein